MEKAARQQWNADLYDTSHSFVSKYGHDLISLLDFQKGERILDLGCGTGDLAKKLADAGVEVLGIDSSADMIKQANQKYPEVSFHIGDATALEFQAEFDAVFSNAVLHWIKEPEKALTSVYESLKSGGRFVADFGGIGNVQTITDEMIEQIKQAGFTFTNQQFPWYFPSIGEYAALMEKAGFHVLFAQHYNRPTLLEGERGLSNWMDMFGALFFEGIPENEIKAIKQRVETNLRNQLYKDGNWIADYKRIQVIGKK